MKQTGNLVEDGRGSQIGLLLLFFLAMSLAFPGTPELFASPFITTPDKPFRVWVYEKPPFAMKLAEGKWTGFSIDLWKHVATEQKSDYMLTEATEKDVVDALTYLI